MPIFAQVATLNFSFVALTSSGEILERLVTTELVWVKHAAPSLPKIASLGEVSARGLFAITTLGELVLLRRWVTETDIIQYGLPTACVNTTNVTCGPSQDYLNLNSMCK